nr:hypothetical protein [uncultured Capnocytophaga sp.]
MRWEGWDNPRLTYSAIADNPKGEERRNSPRLTYSAIADNPEGGQAGKWRLRVGGVRIKNNFY